MATNSLCASASQLLTIQPFSPSYKYNDSAGSCRGKIKEMSMSVRSRLVTIATAPKPLYAIPTSTTWLSYGEADCSSVGFLRVPATHSGKRPSMATAAALMGTKENPVTETLHPPPTSAEADSEKMIGVGDIVEVGTFTVQLLYDVLNKLMSVDRKAAIAVKNYTNYKFVSSGVYFESGTSETNIPYKIDPQYAALWGVRKSENAFRGCVGNFSYHIEGQNKTLFLMWSIPYDYNLYSNWWNATIVDGYHSASYDTYSNLYYGTGGMPYPNRAGPWVQSTVKGFRLLGVMLDAGKSIIELEIHDN